MTQGSFGNVYVGRLKGTHRKYAIKCINVIDVLNRGVKDQMLREVSIMEALTECEYVVELLNYFEDDNFIYLVMDFMEKGSLSDYLDQFPKIREKKTAQIMRDLILGLGELRRHRVIHRDLKPSNILLDAGLNPRITDFGLAVVIPMGKTDYSDAHTAGTLDYMSPEMVTGSRYDYSIDTWAIGAIFYECLHGLPPFTSVDNQNQTQVAVTQEMIKKGKFQLNENISVRPR
jgi:serine/threonine protein kinase